MAKRGNRKALWQQRKVIFWLVVVVTVAIIIEIFILNSFNRKNSNRTSLVLLNQVVSILEENDKNENELIKTLKEDYIVRAQTVSYILDSNPEAEQDVTELKKIAGMMKIDEIHLMDKTGKIYGGTEPKYYGLDFDSGDQISYFKPMLKDKSLTMCQDVTPNTAEGKSMMYAITWNEAGDKMVQVGIEPLRLLEELRQNEISEVIADMPTYDGIDIWVADAESGEICAATDSSLVGSTLDKLGIGEMDFKSDTVSKSEIRIDGYKNYCNAMKTNDYIVVVAFSTSANIQTFLAALVIEVVYLMLSGIIIIYMIKRVLRANDEKNTQMAVLVSMSDIYNSMHLIDLEQNTVMEYHAPRDEVSQVVNSNYGADEAMERIMTMTSEVDYCEGALKFTDVHTLADRMKDRKIISEEFMSKAIGWYRASFITIEADENGQPVKVLYVTQNIDKEKKKEEELIFKSNADELTGLYNRRAYEDDIAERGDTVTEGNFVFVSMDVNGLKTVNDTMGHIAGDELLFGAATCMRQCFEPYGKIYRTGGDEFVAMIFANETQLQYIKRDFEHVTASWSGSLVKKLSVSCGYVTKREADTASVHEMANFADKRMYEAKSEYYRKSSNPEQRRTGESL
jgi:diguanylate cyclase (GGDEF)-like protein